MRQLNNKVVIDLTGFLLCVYIYIYVATYICLCWYTLGRDKMVRQKNSWVQGNLIDKKSLVWGASKGENKCIISVSEVRTRLNSPTIYHCSAYWGTDLSLHGYAVSLMHSWAVSFWSEWSSLVCVWAGPQKCMKHSFLWLIPMLYHDFLIKNLLVFQFAFFPRFLALTAVQVSTARWSSPDEQ